MWVLGIIIGAVLGSFAKATAERLASQAALSGRSYCLSCKKTIRWYDLFPILSFLALKGRCRYCHKRIPLSDFIAEIMMAAALASLFYLTLPANVESLLILNIPNIMLLFGLVFKSYLVTVLAIVFWTDLKAGIIPDKITYPAIALSLAYLIISTALTSWNFYTEITKLSFGKYLLPPYSTYLMDNLQRVIISTVWSLGAAFIVTLFFILLIVATKGKGMGWGDVKYVLLLGLALGYPNILLSVFLAFISGSVVGVILLLLNKKHFGQTIPFGPFLSLGAFIALLYGNELINWYLNNLKLN